MHALALEFTYLWKLNREHWLRVWCHICMRLQLWTGTSALTRARPCSHVHTASSLWTAGSVCSVSALFVPSVSHNGPCAVCVCTAPTAQTALVSDPFGIQAHSEAGFCWRRTQNCQGLAPGRACKTGAKFIEKSGRLSEMHLIHVARRFIDNVSAI